MRKLVVLLFAVGLLAASMLAPTASANQSNRSCPGVFDIAHSASDGANYNPGQANHACSG